MKNLKFIHKLYLGIGFLLLIFMIGNIIVNTVMLNGTLKNNFQRELSNITESFYQVSLNTYNTNQWWINKNLAVIEHFTNNRTIIDSGISVSFEIENQITHERKLKNVPLLSIKNNVGFSEIVSSNTDLVDYITKTTGAPVTIFQLIDEGLLRITTSLRKEDGRRAIGTYIPTESPVYQAIVKGSVFTGRAFVINDWNISAYKPIFKNGKVVGAFNISKKQSDLTELGRAITEFKFADQFFPFIIDTDGNLVVHYNHLDGNVSDFGIDSEFSFVKDLISKLKETKEYEGNLTYTWRNSEKLQKKRILHYKYLPEMEWIIATAMDKDTITKPLIEQSGVSILLSIVLFIIIFILIILGAKKFTRQLHLLTDSVERYAAKEFDARAEIISNDEIGNLAGLFNKMAEKLNLLHRNLEAKVDEKTEELLGKTEELQQQNEEIEQQNEEIKAINDEMAAMNQDLVESEAKVRRLIDNLEDEFIFFSKDIKGKYEYVSPSVTKILGYTQEEVEYGLEKYNTNNTKNTEAAALSQKVKSGEKGSMIEIELYDKQGNIRQFELLEVPVLGELDNVVMIEGILHDITHRKEIEQSEEKNRVLFDKITNSANDAIVVIDNNAQIIFWNNSAERIFGYTKEEIHGKDLYDQLAIERYRKILRRGFKNFKATGKGKGIGTSIEIPAITKGGKKFTAELSLSAMDLDNEWHAIGIVRDISERKRIELVQNILSNISSAVLTSENLQGLIVVIRERLSKIIDTQNFYIAIYDEEKDMLSLPFIADENDKIESFPAGKTMTAHVIRTKKSLLVTSDQQEELEKQGYIDFVGSRSKVWLGVPLVLDNKVMGVLAVQSYTDKNAYTAEDQEVLEIISNQVSLALERKRSSDNLSLEKEYAEHILNVIPSAVFTVDNDKIITSWNKMAEEVSGYTAEEIVGNSCEVFSPVPCGGHCGLHDKTLNKPITKRECKLLTKSGDTRLILKNVDYIKDLDDNVIGGIESFQDITERKRMELVQHAISNISNAVALSENIETLIRKIQAEISNIIDTKNFFIALYHKETDSFTLPFLADENDDIVAFPAGKTMTNYVVKTGQSLIVTDKEQEKLVKEGKIEFKGSRSKIWLGVPLISKDEVIGALVVQSYEDENAYSEADLEIMEIFSNQISMSIERKKAGDQIRQQNVELSEQKEELTVTLDDLKETQSQLIQSEKMAALGQLIAGIAHEINTPLGAINASVGNMADSLTETMGKMPDIIKHLSDDELNSFLKIIDLAEEETPELTSKEKRQYKRSIRTLLEENSVAEYDKIAETIVYMKLYDHVNTVLPILKSPNISLILSMARNIISMRKNTQNINMAVSKASKVVIALKKFAHRDHLGEKVPSDIIDGIDTVLTLYHNQIKQGVELIKEYSELPMVYCYEDDMNQVWTNLLHNSLQAMENKGTITIKTQKLKNTIKVFVTDTGGGIPEEVQDKIFMPFFTTKKAGEGSGLGLDIVKKIIDKHDGKIEFETEVGKGTTFIITLPIE